MKLRLQLLLTLITAILSLQSAHTLAEGDPASGKAKAAMCGACHGADGNSLADSYPKLAGLGAKYLRKQITDIKNGDRTVAAMTGMLNALSEQDIADIAAYYDSNTRQTAGSKEQSKALKLGENIYRAGNLETNVPACTGCHSPSGKGNTPAGYPALGGQYAKYIATQLRAFRTAAHDTEDPSGRKNDSVAVMRGVTAHMSEQEIDAVANYIAGLHQ